MPARVTAGVVLMVCLTLSAPVTPALGQSAEPPAPKLPPLTAETVGCPETAGVAEPAPNAGATVDDCRWLVIGEGTADGRPWRVVAAAVADESWWWWLEVEHETTGSMVSGPAPTISAMMRADPHVAYGVVGPQVSRALLETTRADVELTIVPLTGIGVEAAAFVEPVSSGTEVEWFVALATDGAELDRLVGPAAGPWASQVPAAPPTP